MARTWELGGVFVSIGESEYFIGVLGRECVGVCDDAGFDACCLEFIENHRSTGNLGCDSSGLCDFLGWLELSEGTLRLKDIVERLRTGWLDEFCAALDIRGEGGLVRALRMLS